VCRLFDLEIINKQIIEKKDKSIQNLHGAFYKEPKLKVKLQARKSENSEVLAKLQIAKQKINKMEKHNKDMENIKVERDSLWVILK
jgi:hypothetical protein